MICPVRLTVGGARLDLDLPESSLDPAFLPFAEDLTGEPGEGPDFQVEIREDLPVPVVETAPGEYAGEALRSTPEGIVAFHSPAFTGSLDFGERRGTFRQTPGSRAYRAGLQVLLSHLLERRGRILVHGAGLVAGGSGWLFSGPSGAGKSTLARMSDLPVLNDELCCLHTGGNGTVTVSGTPFGFHTCAGEFPLTRIFWLEKSTADELGDWSPPDALNSLFSQTVSGAGDPAHLAGVFRRVADVVRRTRLHRLRFTRSRRFLDVIRAAG